MAATGASSRPGSLLSAVGHSPQPVGSDLTLLTSEPVASADYPGATPEAGAAPAWLRLETLSHIHYQASLDKPGKPRGVFTPGCRIRMRRRLGLGLLRGIKEIIKGKRALQALENLVSSHRVAPQRSQLLSPPSGHTWNCLLVLGALPTWWYLLPDEAQGAN